MTISDISACVSIIVNILVLIQMRWLIRDIGRAALKDANKVINDVEEKLKR